MSGLEKCPIMLIQAGSPFRACLLSSIENFNASFYLSETQIMKKTIVFMLCVVVIVIACTKNNNATFTTDCSGEAKSYTTDVSPIIQSYCASNSGCHASGSTNGPGALTTFQQVYNARAAIRSAVASGSMPQNSTLSSSQKNILICWIDNGATNN